MVLIELSILRLFLLRAAVGCRDLRAPPNGVVERHGDKATVSCNFTSDVWHLVCNGDSWVGSFKNCSTGTHTTTTTTTTTGTRLTFVISALMRVRADVLPMMPPLL